MTVILGILATLFLLMSALWALLPGGFGLANFVREHGILVNILAIATYLILIGSHILVLYQLWSGISNDKEIIFRWLLLPIAMQVVFFAIFGRDVGTQ